MTTAIYLRVSTTDKGQDTAMQETACRKLCEFKNLKNIEVFSDKKSGRDSNRPDYQRLLSRIITGDVRFVVAYKLDRISRSVQDLLTFATLCRSMECHFTFAASPELDTSSAAGQLMFTILGAFAAFESQMTAERVKDGMQQKKREGRSFGGDRKSVHFTRKRIEPYLYREKPWQLLIIREQLRMDRKSFYRAIEKMEQLSSGLITDESDERYKASIQPFPYKRVDKSGKYLDPKDPRIALLDSGRHEAALRHVQQFFEKYDSEEKMKNFVDFALANSTRALDIADVELELE